MVDAFKVNTPIENGKRKVLIPLYAAGLCCSRRRLLDK